MSAYWWTIPGPSRFIARVVDKLRDGRNVVLRLPNHAPGGLTSAVRCRLGEATLSWHAFTPPDDQAVRPANWLFDRFCSDAPKHLIQNAASLARQPSFGGQLFWIDEMPASIWPAWHEFLDDYAHGCRTVDLIERSVFCVCLRGDLAATPVNEEVCLADEAWHGYVGRLDLLIFAYSLVSTRVNQLERDLAIHLATELAGWDSHLCARLVQQPLSKLLCPGPTLVELAAERGWVNPETLPVPSWHRGLVERVDGNEIVSSLAIAVCGDRRELDRRVWAAETTVLLPFVERRRREILDTCAHWLSVPFVTPFGEVVKERNDLEIGQIDSQFIMNGRAVPQRLKALVGSLRRIRNSLAHLEPVDPALMALTELTSSLENL